ncbi:MAG: DHH family phosphoesterase [Candidatus Njordarchaeia archaeon]
MSSSKNLRKELDKKTCEKFIEKISHDVVLIVPHESTDLDAYASALILHKIINLASAKTKTFIILPQPSQDLKKFLIKMKLPDFAEEYEETKKIIRSQLTQYISVLVDTSSVKRFTNPELREIIEKSEKILAIDHHLASEENLETLSLERSSTTVVTLELAEKLDLLDRILSDRKICNAAIGGILSDTAFLYYVDQPTFHMLSKLIKCGNYQSIYSALKQTRKELPERIARIKGAKRAEMIRKDDKIILVSHVNSYEASVASSLINLGANISIVISKKKERNKTVFRVIARGSGIDLSKLFSELAEEIGGQGGGHPSAAGMVIDEEEINDESTLAKLIIRRLLEVL